MDTKLLAAALRTTIFKAATVEMPARFDPETLLVSGGFRREVAGDDFARISDAAASAHAERVGILISGEVGCGKTLAMKCLFPPSSPPKRDCRWISCFDRVQIGWLDDHDIWTWANCIVLDDLGSDAIESNFGVQRFAVADFFMRMARRMDSGEYIPRICVTTNFSAEDISERYGGRMLSRMLSVVVPVRMCGKDHRRNFFNSGFVGKEDDLATVNCRFCSDTGTIRNVPVPEGDFAEGGRRDLPCGFCATGQREMDRAGMPPAQQQELVRHEMAALHVSPDEFSVRT